MKSEESKKSLLFVLMIFSPAMIIFSVAIQIFNLVIGTIFMIAAWILFLYTTISLPKAFKIKGQKEVIFYIISFALSLMILPFSLIEIIRLPDFLAYFFVFAGAGTLLVAGYGGFYKASKERNVPFKKSFFGRWDMIQARIDTLSGDILAEMTENKSHPDLVLGAKRTKYIFYPFVVMCFIFVLAVFYYLIKSGFDAVPLLCLCAIVGGCCFVIYDIKRFEKNLSVIRREIIITDEEIKIPFQMRYPRGIILSEPAALALSGNIRYKDIESYKVDSVQSSIEIITKDYNMKLFLSQPDIEKMIGFIKKYSKISTFMIHKKD